MKWAICSIILRRVSPEEGVGEGEVCGRGGERRGNERIAAQSSSRGVEVGIESFYFVLFNIVVVYIELAEWKRSGECSREQSIWVGIAVIGYRICVEVDKHHHCAMYGIFRSGCALIRSATAGSERMRGAKVVR